LAKLETQLTTVLQNRNNLVPISKPYIGCVSTKYTRLWFHHLQSGMHEQIFILLFIIIIIKIIYLGFFLVFAL